MDDFQKAIFLDRDGIVNYPIIVDGKSYAPTTSQDFVLVPGLKFILEAFHSNGYLVFVVTNQPDLKTGKIAADFLNDCHRLLTDELGRFLQEIVVCPHVDADLCSCRKPKAGMITALAEKYRIDLSKSWLIGDRWRDVGAGTAAGCRTILVDYHYPETSLSPDFQCDSLLEAAEWILQKPLTAHLPTACAAVLLSESNACIFLKDKSSSSLAGRGLWGLPGGALIAGEDPVTGVKRQVLLDTGHQLDEPQHLTSFLYDRDARQPFRVELFVSRYPFTDHFLSQRAPSSKDKSLKLLCRQDISNHPFGADLLPLWDRAALFFYPFRLGESRLASPFPREAL